MKLYEQYDYKDAFGLRAMRGDGPERTWNREDVGPKTTVLGIVHGGDAVGYPPPAVRAAGASSPTRSGNSTCSSWVRATASTLSSIPAIGSSFVMERYTMTASRGT